MSVGIDVAAGHDDDVLHAAADHDVAVLGQVAEVAGVVPAVLVLRRDEAAHGDVAGRDGFAAQLDDADAAGGHHVALLVDDPGLETLAAAGRAWPACGCCPSSRAPPGAARPSGRRRPRRPPGPHCTRRTTPPASSRPCRRRAGSPTGFRPNGLPASSRSSTSAGSTGSAPDSAKRSVDRSNSPGLAWLPQPLGEQRVGEVRRRGHRALVLVDQPGPQQGVAQEVHRRDLDQLGAEVHRDGQEADHAHVVEAGQPADHDVLVDVVLGADEHRLGVGVDVAVRDLHGLGRARRAATSAA